MQVGVNVAPMAIVSPGPSADQAACLTMAEIAAFPLAIPQDTHGAPQSLEESSAQAGGSAEAAVHHQFTGAAEGTSLPPEDIDWRATGGLDVAGLRIGRMLDAGCGLAVEPEVEAAVRAAARCFAAAGAIVTEVRPVLTREMLDGLDVFWRARFWGEMLKLNEGRRAMIPPCILDWAKAGAAVTGVAAAQGFDQTMAMRRTCGALFREVDVVLSPTNPIVSFPADWASPTNDPTRPFEHIAFTVPWNMSDQPAASINCGFSPDGLPIGLQIVGPRFADLMALRLSALYESRRGPITTWPPPETTVRAKMA